MVMVFSMNYREIFFFLSYAFLRVEYANRCSLIFTLDGEQRQRIMTCRYHDEARIEYSDQRRCYIILCYNVYTRSEGVRSESL